MSAIEIQLGHSNIADVVVKRIRTDVIKIRWRFIAWSVEKILKNVDTKMVRTKNNRLIMQAKCPVCTSNKSRFVKEQERKSLLSNLGIKTPLSKTSLKSHSQKSKKELNSLCKLEIQILFTKTSLISLVFNTIWLMANQKI